MNYEFLNLYEELTELWDSSTLQESTHIKTLEKAYKTNPDDLCNMNLLRANTVKFKFLQDEAFNPYFAYLEDIFIRNGNCRYIKVANNARGSYQNPEAHHIVFKSLGGSDDASNLIALFRTEHLETHIYFLKGILNYYNKATDDRDFLEEVLVNATGSVNILNKYKQGNLSKEKLMDKLVQLLSNEENIDHDSINNLTAQINGLNKSHMKAAVNRATHGGSGNLRAPDKDTYIVSFLDGYSETVNGQEGVQKLIYTRNADTEYAREISIPQVMSFTTTPNKNLPRYSKKYLVKQDKFTEFGLAYPNGIYKTTDNINAGKRHKSMSIIYFPVLKKENNVLIIDYSSGKWVSSPNAFRGLKIGFPDDAYKRLDEIHNDLITKLDLYRIFKSKKSDDNKDRENYIFMYADDIELLQEVIDIKNKERTEEDQITLRVTQDGQPWYINRQRI